MHLMEEVRAGARAVAERAVHVSIDQTAVEALAARIAAETRGRGEARDATGAGWDETIHFVGPEGATVQYLFVLDALNFCFWPSEGKWEYADLSSALKAAAEADELALSADALAEMDAPRLRALLGGRDLPDMPSRVRLLREVGSVLNDKYRGSAANLVEECGGSAVALVAAVVRDFPGFRDEAHYPSLGEVRFYKRAQIFVGDVYGALKGQGLGRFADVGQLTMFADYRVPQILRQVREAGHQIIAMIKWIRTSRLSIKNSLCRWACCSTRRHSPGRSTGWRRSRRGARRRSRSALSPFRQWRR